jgi:hypothetical protein
MQDTLQCCIGCNVQDNITPQTLVMVFVEDNNRQITTFFWETFAYSIGIIHELRIPVGQITLDLIRTTFPKIGKAAVLGCSACGVFTHQLSNHPTFLNHDSASVLEMRSPPEQAVYMENTTAETCDAKLPALPKTWKSQTIRPGTPLAYCSPLARPNVSSD